MDTAREIWRDDLRAARQPLLEALDVEFMRAVEAKDEAKQDEIAEKKQELRDVPQQDLQAATNFEELRAMWPDCLGNKEKFSVARRKWMT